MLMKQYYQRAVDEQRQHIGLGLMKQFTRALDKDGNCFVYLSQAFLGFSLES